jgi:hypothetical protein
MHNSESTFIVHKFISFVVVCVVVLWSTAEAQIHISIPAVHGKQGDTVLVPMMIDDITASSVFAYQFVLSFDRTAVTVTDLVTTGTLSGQNTWNVMTNLSADSVRVGAFGAYAMTGGGVLVQVKVVLKGAPGSVSSLVFASPMLNAGNPASTWSNGTMTVDNISQITVSGTPGVLPREFHLAQNYPNPFNPSTTIMYGLAQDSRVTLELFSELGQRVCTLVDEHQAAGQHQVVFTDPGLASGVYYYQLRALGSGSTTTRPMVETRMLHLLK